MPMKYIGKNHYGIFQTEFLKFGHVKIAKDQVFDKSFLINNFEYLVYQKITIIFSDIWDKHYMALQQLFLNGKKKHLF